jgi:isopentenyl-diphosphate delta-isomerase
MTEQQLVLVNEYDEAIGVMDKLEAHQKGLLHRAFSIFIFNSRGEMLLQQRADQKYHSAGLWTNACCSHPQPGEETGKAASRRLMEEMGFSTPLHKLFEFLYRAEMENGLTEHEFDHVYTGQYEGAVHVNKEEVKDFCYKEIRTIREELQTNPENYTPWFRLAFPEIENWWHDHYKNVVA